MENQRSSVKFWPPTAVVLTCRYCSESCEAEVAQGPSLIKILTLSVHMLQIRDFPAFLNNGPGAALFGKTNSLIFKLGKTGLEKLNSLIYFKIIPKHGKLHLRSIKSQGLRWPKIFGQRHVSIQAI